MSLAPVEKDIASRKILLFRDFVEDRRRSMEVYADHLIEALPRTVRAGWQIDSYRPGLPRPFVALPIGNSHRMRLARLLAYPWQARLTRGSDLNHIIDHGYGHLALALNAGCTVVTVHDLIPLLRRKGIIRGVTSDGWHPLSEFPIRALKRASHLIADSDNTKGDLIRHLGYEADRITVIHLGVDPSFRPSGAEEKKGLRAKLGLPDDGSWLVLVFGGSFYKNEETSLTVVQELQHVCRRPVILVRVGPSTVTWRQHVTKVGMGDRVVELVSVPEHCMSELYNAVDCLLFPSWYEGFGLPPIEAMACGIPAVTSNAGSLPESVGEAGLTGDPDDIRTFVKAVRLILEDPVRRHEQIAKGFSHARNFTWERTAAETAKVYEMLLGANSTSE